MSSYWKYIFNEMVGVLYLILGAVIASLQPEGVLFVIMWIIILNGLGSVVVAAYHRYTSIKGENVEK